MKKIIPLIALCCFLFQAEANCFKKKRKKTRTTRTTRTSTKSTSVSTLVVSFISMGSGIDYQALPDFERDLKAFNGNNSCNLTYQVKSWGREGEKDYCITAKTADCLKKYTESVQMKYRENPFIVIKVNAACRE